MSNQSLFGWPQPFQYYGDYSTMEAITLYALALFIGVIFFMVGDLIRDAGLPIRAHVHYLVAYWFLIALGLGWFASSWPTTFGECVISPREVS